MTTPEILSIVAIVMSSITLSWQVVSWRRTGAVVKVTARVAFVVGNPVSLVSVKARNSGRTAVTVTGWGFRFPAGDGIVQAQPLPISAEIPHRLEPGAEASWFMELDAIKETCAAHGVRHQDVVAWVDLGSGRTVKANKRGIGMA